MATTTSQLQEVYAQLGEVLDNPRAFGLGDNLSYPLAERLCAMRQKLELIMGEELEAGNVDDLEQELSQDADRFCHANAWPS